MVGSSDAGIAEYYEMMYEGIDTLDSFMAGDLDGDAMPGASDAGDLGTTLETHCGRVGSLTSGLPHNL